MAAFRYLQKSALVVVFLLGVLLVWCQTVVVHHKYFLLQEHPTRSIASVSPGKDFMRGLNPARRSLKQLLMNNLERVNCTPFDPNTFRQKREAGKVNLEFMCLNETQLWDDIQRNRSLTQLKQYDAAKSALLQAILDSLDKDGISTDLDFQLYLKILSADEQKLPQLHESDGYYRKSKDVSLEVYGMQTEQSPNYARKDSSVFSNNKDIQNSYLRHDVVDKRTANNQPMLSQKIQSRPRWPVPQFDSSKYLNQMRFHSRDSSNAAGIIHPQFVGALPQLNTADARKKLDNKLSGPNVRMNPDLNELAHMRLPANTDLHSSRNFSKSHNYSTLAHYMKYLDRAVNASSPQYRSETQYSLNPDLLLRSRFQQQKMKEFCSENPVTARLPSNSDDLDTLFQHLLYDDSKRIVYCYVPKNGCSNMKRTFLILNGILPPESVAKRPPETKLKEVKSFRNLSRDEALNKLENYLKFAIVRNPMERLLSAFRNKLESPLQLKYRTVFPDKVKAYILRNYRRMEFMEWLENTTTRSITPSFGEFARFMTRYPLSHYNEHFMPVLNLCYPCAVQYDLYLNFKSLDYDVYALMDYLDIPKSYYPHVISHKAVPTSTYMNDYFARVSKDVKEQLFKVFAEELRFYHALYPEEWSMYRELAYGLETL